MKPPRLWVGPLLVATFPTPCFACGEPLGIRQRLGACPTCWADLRPLTAPLCRSCAWPLSSAAEITGADGGRCGSCCAGRPALDAITALVSYEAGARRFLLRGKVARRREMLGALGAQLAQRVVLDGLAPEGAIIVPVPSHPLARLQRGFAPAEEIARPIAVSTGLPCRALLRRRWRSGPLKRLGAGGRRGVAKVAFATRRRVRVDGGIVLLVDDVLTTGATLAACASALRNAGAAEVRAAVWARTPGPSGALLL